VIVGIGLHSIFLHGDLTIPNPTIATPTPFFAINFLIRYGLGWLFIDALILSVLVGLWLRHNFRRFLGLDTICLATIICVLGANTYLGAALALKSPFLNAIKYNYQALPFLSFLAASLISKSIYLFKLGNLKSKIRKVSMVAVALLGLILVTTAVVYNMHYINLFSRLDYLIFRVAPNINEGYSFFNPNPIGESSLLLKLQYIGFAVTLSGLVWISRHKLNSLLAILRKNCQIIKKPMKIKLKKAKSP
jgi:hypothetical protein